MDIKTKQLSNIFDVMSSNNSFSINDEKYDTIAKAAMTRMGHILLDHFRNGVNLTNLNLNELTTMLIVLDNRYIKLPYYFQEENRLLMRDILTTELRDRKLNTIL